MRNKALCVCVCVEAVVWAVPQSGSAVSREVRTAMCLVVVLVVQVVKCGERTLGDRAHRHGTTSLGGADLVYKCL